MLISFVTESGGLLTLIPRRRRDVKDLDAAVFYVRFLYTYAKALKSLNVLMMFTSSDSE